MNTRHRRLIPCVTLLALAVGLTVSAGEPSTQRRFMDGLRDRQLFVLAESYCRRRLQTEELSSRERAELVIELALTQAVHAANLPPTERGPLWESAGRLIDDFTRQYPENPGLPLVKLQDAMIRLARGELARQESQLVADNVLLREEALNELRAAIRLLDALYLEVEQALQGRSTGTGDADQLTDRELLSLQRNIQYQHARALRNQGLCYGAESADRANSLTQAVGLLGSLPSAGDVDPLDWNGRLDAIACYRLLMDFDTAQRAIHELLVQQPPASIVLKARAEQIRLALATGDPAAALAVVNEGRDLNRQTVPELDFAWLEALLVIWNKAGEDDDPSADQWQSRATDQLARIELSHGPYWTRRAEMLLAGSVEDSPGNEDLELRVRVAENAYRSGRVDESLTAYDQAKALAEQQGNAGRAFELGYIAAAVENERGRHVEAMTRFRELALAMRDYSRATEAHLAAIELARQIAGDRSAGSFDRYVTLLEEHADQWPDAESTDAVRWQIGRLAESQGNFAEAIEAYCSVGSRFAQFDQVVTAAGRCYMTMLGRLRASGEATVEPARQGAVWFEQWANASHPVAMEAALIAARLHLNFTPDGYVKAEQILAPWFSRVEGVTPEQKVAIESILIVALAGQGRRDEAAGILASQSQGTPTGLLEMLEGLQQVAADAQPRIAAELAGLQLQVIQQIAPRREKLSESERRTLDLLHARALATSGRTTQSLAILSHLSQAYPRDGEIQEDYARSLAVRTDRTSLEAALTQWRAVEQRSPSGTPRWFRAQYAVAELHFRLGNKAQAAKMINLLKVLHPEMGGEPLRGEFLGLLKAAQP